MASFGLAFTIARRELRGAILQFRVFLIALTLGVAAIGAVGSIADAMREGISVNSRQMFGGDLDASATHKPVPAPILAEMRRHGQTSSIIQMRAMLAGQKNAADGPEDIRRLVALKVVDDAWPLIGTPTLEPAMPLDQALRMVDGMPGIIANPGVLRVLGAEVGDTVRLGDADVYVSALLVREPDRGIGFAQFAPSVVIADDHLEMTGLNVPGALMTYRERLLLDDPSSDKAVLDRLNARSDNSLVRLRHHRQGAAGFQNFLTRTETFLTLVSLTALLIGGLGVSSAVRAWLTSRMPVLATLKCLGAPAALIFRVYLIQVMVLTVLGIMLGLGLAVMTPWLVKTLLLGVIPVPIETGLYLESLLGAAGFGLLTALTFSVWPLGKAREVKPSHLFRTMITVPSGRPKKRYLSVIITAMMGLAGLTWWVTTSPILAIGFMLGVLGALALLALLAEAIIRIVKTLPRPTNTALRFALAAVVRPGNATRTVVVTFGLGLAVLVAIALSEFNMNRQINTRLADDAPAWFFIDIQPHQKDDFLALTGGLVGTENIMMVPLVRGRIVALNGVPAAEINAPQSEEWILRGDRGLTWSATPPDGANIVKGTWWDADYRGPLQVSIDDEAMVAFGLDLGDTVTINVAGRELVATITSSRVIEWQNFGLNFVFVLSPGVIAQAPHNWVATAATDDTTIEAQLDREVAAAMPNVSSISVREAANTVGRILSLVSVSIQITAGITLIAGFAVLAGTVAAGEARRIQSSIILKVLGATRRTILLSYIYEYLLLGLITGLVAVAIGAAASYAILVVLLQTTFTFAPVLAAMVALGGAAATVILGLIGASRTLGRKPGPVLRQE